MSVHNTILFSNLVGPLRLSKELPALEQATRIVGPGRDELAIVWAADGVLLTVNPAVTASVECLTMRGLGFPYASSGISNCGALTVSGVDVRDFSNGGMFSTGSLAVLNSTLLNNAGGGINSSGDLVVSKSVIAGCQNGSGIVATGPRSRIEYSAIRDNQRFGHYGYALCFGYYPNIICTEINAEDGTGAGLYLESGSASIIGCTISGNRAYGGDAEGSAYPYPAIQAGAGLGGGIFLGSGVLTMTNCTLATNAGFGGSGLSSPRGVSRGGEAVGAIYHLPSSRRSHSRQLHHLQQPCRGRTRGSCFFFLVILVGLRSVV